MNDETLDTLVKQVLGPWPMAFGESVVINLRNTLIQAYNIGWIAKGNTIR